MRLICFPCSANQTAKSQKGSLNERVQDLVNGDHGAVVRKSGDKTAHNNVKDKEGLDYRLHDS